MGHSGSRVVSERGRAFKPPPAPVTASVALSGLLILVRIKGRSLTIANNCPSNTSKSCFLVRLALDTGQPLHLVAIASPVLIAEDKSSVSYDNSGIKRTIRVQASLSLQQFQSCAVLVKGGGKPANVRAGE